MIKTPDDLARYKRNSWLVLAGASVILCAFYAISLVFSYRTTVASETKRLLTQAEIVQQNFGLQLQTTANALDAVKSLATNDLTPDNGTTFTGRLELLQKSLLGVSTIAIVDAKGVTVASNRPEVIGFNARDTERYKTLRSDNDPGKLYISDPYLTPRKNYSIALEKTLQDPRWPSQTPPPLAGQTPPLLAASKSLPIFQ